MRVACASLLLLAGLLGACATTVRDLPPGEAPAPGEALVAGRLAFSGTKVDPRLHLRGTSGDEIVVRPSFETFLVALPAGTWEVRRFGDYEPVDDRPSFEAVPGEARYLGTFEPVRDDVGRLAIAVRNELDRVRGDLRQRYGDVLPAVEGGLVRSSLAPAREGDLVIAVRRVESPPPHLRYQYYGYGYPYPYYWGYERYWPYYPWRRVPSRRYR